MTAVGHRTPLRRAWPVAVWVATLAVALATGALLVSGASHATPADDFGLSGLGGASFVVSSLAFANVGAMVAVRVPGNPLGPIFCLIALILGLGDGLFQYADQALFIAPDRWPAGAAAAWLQNWGLPPCFGLLGIAVLLFPDGRLPARRWRPAVALAVAGIVLNGLGYSLRPGPLDDPFATVGNPLGIPGAFHLMDALSGLGWMFMGASVGLAAVGCAKRLRRSRGLERAQLKCLALGAAIAGVAIVSDVVSYFVSPSTDINPVRNVVLGVGFAAFPVAAGVAILRRRLYDIDVVINRTLVYGALTVTLAATYLGMVLVIGLAIGRQSGLAVALSTLTVAALFRPARARIQAAVDRRFYRQRYDAAQTLEAFATRLRDELDLQALTADLRGVVSETVAPAHISLWLRESSGRNDSRTHGP